MKILLTGSNGYIAKSISKNLYQYNIINLCRSDADLTNPEDVKKFFKKNNFFDVVIHTAIVGGNRLNTDNSKTIDDNLKMYYNLLEHRDKFNKFISFGSGAEVYALNTPYGLSKKIIAESMKDKPNFYNLRIFGVFDENELDTRFIKANILNVLSGRPIEIFENKKMDFFYMKDLISLIEFYLLKNNLPKEINCTYTEKMSLLEVGKIINECVENKSKINVINNYNKEDYIGSSNLPIECIGLKNGILKTFNIMANQHIIKQ